MSRPKPKGWAYEGIACYVSTDPKPDYVPLYRAYNDSDHFYTTSKGEYDGLPASYRREGIACYVERNSSSDNVALYRLYNGKEDDHLYTTSLEERNILIQHGWRDEGIECYVKATPVTGHVPFYRAYNDIIHDHFYTTSDQELDDAAPKPTSGELRQILEADLQSVLGGNPAWYFADNSYFSPRRLASDALIANSRVQFHIYTPEVFDCDDFALALKASFIEDQYTARRIRTVPYAIGIVWGSSGSGGHAMNVIVLIENGDYVTYLIEPQNGLYYRPSERKLFDIYMLMF